MAQLEGDRRIAAAIFDLDGVIRHPDTAAQRGVELRYGLEQGAILSAAFEPRLLHRALRGEIGWSEWAAEVGRVIGSPEAAYEWLFTPAIVDHDAVALVADVRAAGLDVAVMTNGVDTLVDELVHDGLDATFDFVVNSADAGRLKPEPEAFATACRRVDVEPDRVFFTDDSAANVAGARAAGLVAFDFRSVDCARRDLVGAGVLPAQSGSA